LKKRPKKLLSVQVRGGAGVPGGWKGRRNQSFLVLFFKKDPLPSLRRSNLFQLRLVRRLLSRAVGAQMPKPLMGRHQGSDDGLAAIGARRDAQQDEFERYKKVGCDLQFAFVAGVIESGLNFVTEAPAVALLVGRCGSLLGRG
jgi:hypothetical protein